MNLTTDVCGDIYWTGDFGGNITFGSTTLSQSGGGDIYVAKYNASGSALWAMKAGGTNYETGQSIVLSAPSNELLVAGYYQSPSVAFGPTTLTNSNVDGFVSRIGLTCSIIPLPVELVSFTGKDDEAVNVLEWVTATEINNDYFTLERSATGEIFETIGTVQGMGNSSVTLNYSFVDNVPLPLSYYRLKQTDFDGTSSYSDVIAIQRETNNVTVFPNPVFDEVLVYSPWKEFTATITDTQGRQVAWMKSEKNTISISVSGLTEGVYFLSLQNGDENVVKRLIKTSSEK
jgi:hypothetical protein